MRLQPTALAAALLAAGLTHAAPPPRTTLTLLPALAGGQASANGINDQGLVVGSSHDGSSSRGFAWTAAGGLQVIGGSNGSLAAVNDLGQAVGWDVFSEPGSSYNRPFVWDAAGGLRALPALYRTGWATAINDQGLIGGREWEFSRTNAVLWDPLTGLRRLATSGEVTGVNHLGQAVGRLSGGAAQLWQSDGSATTLTPLYGSSLPTTPAGISDAGVAVGSTQGAGGTALTAFAWEAQRGMRDLGGLGGGESAARAIGASGQIVGQARRADGQLVATLWAPGGGARDLAALAGGSAKLTAANGLNHHAQVVGTADVSGGTRAFLLTLHPDWSGGDGSWDDATGTRWNWAGTGTAAARVGRMHDVVIDPGFSVTVRGSAEGAARTLRLGGTAGTLVTLDLNGGSTRIGDGDAVIYNPSVIGAGGVLRGSGRLEVREDLRVAAGGRIQVDGGQAMQLAIDYLDHQGLIRAQGTAAAPARLEVTGGAFYNQAGALVQLVQADAVLDSGLSNFGQVSLQSASLTLGAGTRLFNFKSAQVGFGFGDSLVNGSIENQGLLVVSNGARVSFTGALANSGELRVSAGGAADFFGRVSGTGGIKGEGEMRFEGGFTVGGPAALAISPDAVFASEISLALDGGQHLAFDGSVALEGASLSLSWAEAGRSAAGTRFDLFDWNGGLAGRFDRLALPELGAGLAWDTTDLYAGGSLAIAAVPEPGAWAMFAAGALALALRRRRGNAGDQRL